MYFFHPQKQIFDHLEDLSFSYSGPTSLGKSLLMRMFIKDKILAGFKGNFAILVPTKALISEISSDLINKDLKDDLAKNNYKVVSSGNSTFFKQPGFHYIMIMTPERMLYTLMSFTNFSINYLFIDEAHKISQADGRSTFYFKVTDMLSQRSIKPHIILASPNIPNPDIYLTTLPKEQLQDTNSFRTTFTPVCQLKYVLDTVKGTFSVFNEHSKNKNPFEFITTLDQTDTVNDLIRKLIQKHPQKSTLVYCSGRSKVVKLARDYAESITSPLGIDDLDNLAKEIREEIHSDYYLADLIQKGVAYHVGYLPLHIRIKIESLYRDKKINVLFCTSTLIEGVNTPADNLIVISCIIGSKENMNAVEFRNLLGRVGRIKYNLYGNVFIIRDKNTSDKTIKELLVKEVPNQEIPLLNNAISYQTKNYIINEFIKGNTQLLQSQDQSNEQYNMMRKTALILLKDIISDRHSVIRSQFDSLLSDENISKIKANFVHIGNNKPQPDDDINVSLNQTQNLINAINNGLKYPKLQDGKVNYYDLLDFLETLSKIFKWNIYEKDTLGYGNKIQYYAVILSRWMNGYGLNLLIQDTLNHNANHGCMVTINNQPVPYNGSQEHKNIVIGDTLSIIENIILFSIANYFLRFSTEYKKIKTNGEQFDNDWYEFVEYGSTNSLTIFFQRNGITRETADYIRLHPEYVVHCISSFKLKKSILNCKKQSVIDEMQDIKYNVPELFTD